MNDYKPEVGHRVRVTFEGVIDRDGALDTAPDSLGARYVDSFLLRHAVSVERLPDPEPEWQAGDVVSGSNGGVFMRSGTRWTGASGHRYDHSDISRPLTLLVRDGKAVQS